MIMVGCCKKVYLPDNTSIGGNYSRYFLSMLNHYAAGINQRFHFGPSYSLHLLIKCCTYHQIGPVIGC